MQQLNIYQAKTQFSRLVEQASKGKTFIIARSGKAVAKLVPLDQPNKALFYFGALRGKIKVADDFDAPLSDKELALFEADL